MRGFRPVVQNTVFVAEELRPFRILFIGNCQAGHHAQIARIAFRNASADYVAVHNASDPARAAEVEAFFDSPQARYDLVIAFTLHDKWGPVSREALETRFSRERVFYIPNLTFDGLHPDMTGIGGLGARVIGPLGDYHSRIAVGGWLAGADLSTTLGFFTGRKFEQLGYFARFRAATEEFRRRELLTDLAFTDLLVSEVRHRISFFTLNHPTPTMFAAFMSQLRDTLVGTGRAQSSGVVMDPALVAESLIEAGAAPIFPEIVEAAGLYHNGSRTYLPPRPGGGYPISVEEYVMRSFASYEEVGRDALLETTNGQACMVLMRDAL